MKIFQVDLHIHTTLSPCGSPDMTPPRILEGACRAGLDLIAICDHNSAGNAGAFIEAARGTNLAVIAGIEITTAEEIHVVGLFPEPSRARQVAARVQATLPETDSGYERRFGDQVLVDREGNPVGRETRALAMASAITLEGAVQLIHDCGGLAVPAHIERPSFSVYSQLGDLPRWIPFDAVEVSPVAQRPIGLREKFARYGFPMVGSSDSHYLHEIGRARTLLDAEAATYEELAAALRRENGRSVNYA
jgi:predicted metal-dependent phosphoesterase TrpH